MTFRSTIQSIREDLEREEAENAAKAKNNSKEATEDNAGNVANVAEDKENRAEYDAIGEDGLKAIIKLKVKLVCPKEEGITKCSKAICAFF